MECTSDVRTHHLGICCGWWLGHGESVDAGSAFGERARRSMLREHADPSARMHKCGGTACPYELSDVGCWVAAGGIAEMWLRRGVGLEHCRLDPFGGESAIDNGGSLLWHLRSRSRCALEVDDRGCMISAEEAEKRSRDDASAMELWDRR